MIDDVYNSKILEFAGNIPRIGRLDDADASATAHSKLCGSKVTIWLKTDNDIVTDFAHDVKACALGQASSSIMAANIVGASAAELRQVREEMRLMLKEVRVNRFDPEKQKGALGDAQIPVQIRTNWYSLNITLFSNELFSRALRDGIKQFVSKREWLPGLGSNQRPSD